ncbi:NACHT domain-containing protein [Streptomyces sp. WAC 00631]|uniref:NACHT domain-containing protein n=1 Tax=Streptomyces sp. WAC 00631 TaxID=2203201 RepID=UPI000F7AF7D7|nr:NACHT domain-containing protein [Streptomyces sp. WAC 00631]MCC5036017.1 NACHT domain-containing protein [Streptomyces sp. WAC 00631]
MDSVTVALRVGSAAITPLVRKLFRGDQPGAGLVARPVRIGSLVSFRGEKSSLTRRDLEKLVRRLVDRAVDAAGPYENSGFGEHEAVVQALADSLSRLGDLDMDDVQAVALGSEKLAAALSPRRPDGLSSDAERLHHQLLQVSCLHIVDFFAKRSTFVARTLAEEARRTQHLVEAVDLLVQRLPAQYAEDAGFEERYRRHLVHRHGRLTIFGIDIDDDWPLDDAYLSLHTFDSGAQRATAGLESEHGRRAALPQRAEQALAGRERVLLRGVAGAGKTTLVQWLTVTTAEWRPSRDLAHLFGRVPFVLPLRALTRAGRELPVPADFLSAVGCPHTAPPGWAERVLTAGRALLLVDGIDEVPEPQRDGTRRWLRDLLREFPGNACLVTGRPSAIRENWLEAEDFHEMSLAPMSGEDVTTFINRWHVAAGAGQDEADGLVTAVRSRQDLSRLATNPLMCGLICALHRAGRGFLPRGREELYEAGLRMLLERRDRQRSVDDGLRMDFRSQVVLLERLAYWLIRNGHSQMERADAIALIDQALPAMNRDALGTASAEEVYRRLLTRSGLLREPAADVVDFVHRTFQDYLAARAVIEHRDFPLLVRNAHLDQWEDVVRMAVAHARADERKRLLMQLIKRGDKVRKHRVRLHLLAMACLEHATELDPEVRREVEQRAAALLPPRTYEEAQAIAAAGHVALELLPGPDGLTDEEAEAVVSAAALVGTDAALPKLAEFREHPSLAVRGRIFAEWGDFDHARYYAAILSGLPPEDGTRLVVNTRTELAALAGFPDHPSLSLFGDFTESEVVGALRDRQTKELSLSCARLTDLRFLRRYRNLAYLALIESTGITDLSPVAELPLRTLLLRQMPGVRDYRCLDALTGLRSLFVGDGMSCHDLEALPARAPLEDLGIPRTVTDLTGIQAWPGLTTLRIIDSEDAASPLPRGLGVLAGMRSMTTMLVPWSLPRALCDSGTPLPQVETLRLMGPEDGEDLREVVAGFPGLRNLVLSLTSAKPPVTVDLAPLREADRLRSVRALGRMQLVNEAAVPQATVCQPPESRY